MKDPKPINLFTSEEVKALGWASETRDEDGHLMSFRSELTGGVGQPTLHEYILEATSQGHSVTFWSVGE